MNGSARTSFPLRPALIAAAVLVLLGVVAAASRSDRPSRPAEQGGRTLPVEFWDYAVTLGMIAIIIVLALAVTLKVPVRGPSRGRFGFSQLIGIAILCGLVVLAGRRMQFPELTGQEGVGDAIQNAGTEEANQQPGDDSSGAEPRAAHFQWPVVFAVGSLGLLGLGLYFARRRFGPVRPVTNPAAALSAALDESVDDLRAERDARRAVIAAYARMERVLESHGFPRFRAEAPLEYLARVLRELRVRSAAVLALTELFERAKFSLHEIDADMKGEAIGALLAVRDDLRAEA